MKRGRDIITGSDGSICLGQCSVSLAEKSDFLLLLKCLPESNEDRYSRQAQHLKEKMGGFELHFNLG